MYICHHKDEKLKAMFKANLSNSFIKLQKQLALVTDPSKPLSRLDIDLLKTMTIEFYRELCNYTPEENQSIVTHTSNVEQSDVEQNIKPSKQVEAHPEEELASTSLSFVEDKYDETLKTKPQTVTEDKPQKQHMDEEKISELFDLSSEKDLSSLLANRRIDHISGSMGVNEKIFTINTLFDGNKELFEQTVDALHAINSFEDAREYLMVHLVERYKWLEPSKFTAAKNFVKHVHRKYV